MTSDNSARRRAGRRGGLRWRGLARVIRRRPGGPPGRLRRRVGAAARLAVALALAGGVYTAFAPSLRADDTPTLSADASRGKALFDTSCTTCHGPYAQGVAGAGPSLVGAGSAAVEFQVSSGRMPMARQEHQAQRKPVVFTPEEIRDLGQFIQELGGGPQVPSGSLRAHSEDPDVQAREIAKGGELFRLNCASCHTFGGGGGALSSGKWAPSVHEATDAQIWAAMLTGPQSMPVFGDNQLSPEEKRQVVEFIHNMKSDPDPGGWGLGRLGPVTEGMAIFLVGMVILIFTTLWIAGKS